MKFTFSPESRPLDGYTIKRAIHRGGFGEVYYALSDAGREVALKLLQHNAEVELRGVQQCLNLSHPNLVTIFDVKQDGDEDYWIIMEYVPGETLDTVLHRYPQGMPVEQVRKWISGIVAGVSYLHSRAIVHRDLKPGNVFRTGDTVKVGDIGLSKFITQSRRSAQTQSVGTVYYMAPEVAKGRYGREVDVYALGVMLYEMLTGEVPFDGESTGEILMKHLSEPPDLQKLPPRLRSVVAQALAKDPAQRFSSLKEFEAAFNNAVLGKGKVEPEREQGVGDSRPGPSFAAGPPATNRPALPAETEYEQNRSRAVIAAAITALVAIVVLRRIGWVQILFLSSAAAVLAYNWKSLPIWGRRARDAAKIASRPRRQRRYVPPSPPPAPPKPRLKMHQHIGRWMGGAFLAVPLTAMLTAGLAFLEPSMFANVVGQPRLDPGSIGLFAATAVLAAWGAMLLPVLGRVRGREPLSHSRLAGLLLGVVVGQVAGAVDSFLLVDIPTRGDYFREAALTTIGERPLLTPGLGPTWLGYTVFFMALFAVRNWSKMGDPARRARFSIWSVLFTVGLAWLIAHVFAFPHEWAMSWGAIVACVAQMASPWEPRRGFSRKLRV